MNVTSAKPRILYFEGEPRWEFKFIRRAVEDDRSLQLASMRAHHAEQDLLARASQDAKELEDGFPTKAEESVRVTTG